MTQLNLNKSQQKNRFLSNKEIMISIGSNTMEREKAIHLKITKSEVKDGNRSKEH